MPGYRRIPSSRDHLVDRKQTTAARTNGRLCATFQLNPRYELGIYIVQRLRNFWCIAEFLCNLQDYYHKNDLFCLIFFTNIILCLSTKNDLEVLLEIVTLKLLCILHLNPLVEIIKSMWNSQLLISKEQRRMLIRGLDIKILNVILKYQNSTVV